MHTKPKTRASDLLSATVLSHVWVEDVVQGDGHGNEEGEVCARLDRQDVRVVSCQRNWSSQVTSSCACGGPPLSVSMQRPCTCEAHEPVTKLTTPPKRPLTIVSAMTFPSVVV